jgi:hypothetical protein
MPLPRFATQKSFGFIIEGLVSVKNSFATSHCQILPLKWVTSSVMCFFSSARSSSLPIVPFCTPVVSQAGIWLCHKSTWPRTNWPWA